MSELLTQFFRHVPSDFHVTNSSIETMNAVTNPTFTTIIITIKVPLIWSNLLMSAFQWIVFAIGTVFNILLLFVLVFHRPAKHRVTQLLVGSLTVANLVMMLSSAWIQGLIYLNDSWSFGLVSCKTFYAMQTMTPYCAMWTLAVLALDR
jgi:hypothetical protein